MVAYHELIEEGLMNAILETNRTAMQASGSKQGASPLVRVTGHSLGGALASVCAIHLYQKGVRLDAILTYGSPRAGNPTFAQWYDRVIFNYTRYAFRVTHYRDPIIHLPPINYFISFRHVPREVFVTRETGDTHTVCDGSGEDHKCSSSTTPLPSSRDHLHYMGMQLGSDICQPARAKNVHPHNP